MYPDVAGGLAALFKLACARKQERGILEGVRDDLRIVTPAVQFPAQVFIELCRAAPQREPGSDYVDLQFFQYMQR